jgi:small-conductance mechanosensitive channel
MYIVALEVLRELPHIIAFPFAFVAAFLHGLVLIVLAVVAAVISVRCMILFAAIAVDAPGADWRNAIADSKGHSWRIFLVLLCTVAPAIIVAAIVAVVLGFSLLTAALAFAVVIPAIVVALTAAVAAAVSRLFAAYSSQLGRPGNLYLRAAV